MRAKIIEQCLNIPFISLILKYDYFIEGIMDSKTQDILNVYRIIEISEDELLLDTYIGLFLYNLKTLEFMDTLHNVFDFQLLPENRIVTSSQEGLLQILSLDNLTTLIHEFESFMTHSLKIFVLPNNKVALYELNKNIPIWDLKDTIIQLEGHTDDVTCLAIYKNKLISGSHDATLKIWNLNTNMCNNTLIGHKGSVDNVLVTQNNLIISTCIYGTIRIWDHEICQRVIDCKTSIKEIITYEDKIITCYENGSSRHDEIHIWNIYTGSRDILVGHINHVNDVCLLPNENLISRSVDGVIKIWDLEQNKCVKTWNCDCELDLLEVCFDKIITNCENGLIIWK